MKLKTLIITVFSILVFSSCTDGINAPDTVSTAFKSMFPDASRVEWELKNGYYVVEFRDNGKEKEAWFDSTGTWLLTKTEIPVNRIPDAIKAGINNSEYASWRIEDVDFIERKDIESIYIVEVEKNDVDMDLYFDTAGNLLKAISGEGDYNSVSIEEYSKVVAVIKSKYPEAVIRDVDVELAYIEVDIFWSNQYLEVTLDLQYKWMQTSRDITWAQVPQAVKTAFANDGYSFNASEDDVEEIVRPTETGEETVYYFELDRELSADIYLFYRADGTELTK